MPLPGGHQICALRAGLPYSQGVQKPLAVEYLLLMQLLEQERLPACLCWLLQRQHMT